MTRELRNGNGATGLILANGGVLTYQHAFCLSSRPSSLPTPYPSHNALPKYITIDNSNSIPTISARAEGEAVIETYTISYNRQNAPIKGFIIGRLTRTNARFVANTADTTALKQLASDSEEPIGRVGSVSHGADGRNIFVFSGGSKL